MRYGYRKWRYRPRERLPLSEKAAGAILLSSRNANQGRRLCDTVVQGENRAMCCQTATHGRWHSLPGLQVQRGRHWGLSEWQNCHEGKKIWVGFTNIDVRLHPPQISSSGGRNARPFWRKCPQNNEHPSNPSQICPGFHILGAWRTLQIIPLRTKPGTDQVAHLLESWTTPQANSATATLRPHNVQQGFGGQGIGAAGTSAHRSWLGAVLW